MKPAAARLPLPPVHSLARCYRLGAHIAAHSLVQKPRALCIRWGDAENAAFHRTRGTSDAVVIIQSRTARGVQSLQRASPAGVATLRVQFLSRSPSTPHPHPSIPSRFCHRITSGPIYARPLDDSNPFPMVFVPIAFAISFHANS